MPSWCGNRGGGEGWSAPGAFVFRMSLEPHPNTGSLLERHVMQAGLFVCLFFSRVQFSKCWKSSRTRWFYSTGWVCWKSSWNKRGILAGKLWLGFLASLSLDFLIYKTGKVFELTSWGCFEELMKWSIWSLSTVVPNSCSIDGYYRNMSSVQLL